MEAEMKTFTSKGGRFFPFLALCALLLSSSGWAQTASKETPKPIQTPPLAPSPNERVFEGSLGPVFDQMVEVLKEKGLYDHPHGKATIKKEKGEIKTPTYRYFKIFSARFPPKELDFRDSYVITVSDGSAPAAPAATKKGAAPAEKSPGKPAAKASGIKVVVERKFEEYDQEKKKWANGDPGMAQQVGITAESLLDALAAKLGTPTTTASGGEVQADSKEGEGQAKSQ
jgi:hypothetical protein